MHFEDDYFHCLRIIWKRFEIECMLWMLWVIKCVGVSSRTLEKTMYAHMELWKWKSITEISIYTTYHTASLLIISIYWGHSVRIDCIKSINFRRNCAIFKWNYTNIVHAWNLYIILKTLTWLWIIINFGLTQKAVRKLNLNSLNTFLMWICESRER